MFFLCFVFHSYVLMTWYLRYSQLWWLPIGLDSDNCNQSIGWLQTAPGSICMLVRVDVCVFPLVVAHLMLPSLRRSPSVYVSQPDGSRLATEVTFSINSIHRWDSAIFAPEHMCGVSVKAAENAFSIHKFAVELAQLDYGITVPPVWVLFIFMMLIFWLKLYC